MGVVVVAVIHTDRHIDTKNLIVAFRAFFFCETPQIDSIFCNCFEKASKNSRGDGSRVNCRTLGIADSAILSTQYCCKESTIFRGFSNSSGRADFSISTWNNSCISSEVQHNRGEV